MQVTTVTYGSSYNRQESNYLFHDCENTRELPGIMYTIFYILIMDETVLVLCEK